MPLPRRRRALACAAALLVAVLALLARPGTAAAQVNDPEPTIPTPAAGADNPAATEGATVTLEVPGGDKPSQSVLIIVLLTLLSVAPALLILLTSFTRIAIVLSLTRNAMGLQGVPPNQVIVGLALFLSLFVMSPTLEQMNEEALQPMLAGEISQGDAYDVAVVPLREFMLGQVGDDELELFVAQTTDERPGGPEDVEMSALVPAFVLSEIKTAFIIGFIVFIPFLVIDLIVSSSLMSMGMMMLPPVLVSLPFKILLFVLVDGWGLVIQSLLESFQ